MYSFCSKRISAYIASDVRMGFNPLYSYTSVASLGVGFGVQYHFP